MLSNVIKENSWSSFGAKFDSPSNNDFTAMNGADGGTAGQQQHHRPGQAHVIGVRKKKADNHLVSVVSFNYCILLLLFIVSSMYSLFKTTLCFYGQSAQLFAFSAAMTHANCTLSSRKNSISRRYCDATLFHLCIPMASMQTSPIIFAFWGMGFSFKKCAHNIIFSIAIYKLILLLFVTPYIDDTTLL